MTTQLGHGRGWLNADAAASVFRIDKALGHPLEITSAGRTHAEQAALVARWNAGGPHNRPPFLYKPAAVGHSPHESGEAIDSNEHAYLLGAGHAHGWVHNIASDYPHFIYVLGNDQYRGTTTPTGVPIPTANPFGISDIRGLQKIARLHGSTTAIDNRWGPLTQAGFTRFLTSANYWHGSLIPSTAAWLRARWGYKGNDVIGPIMRAALTRANTANYNQL